MSDHAHAIALLRRMTDGDFRDRRNATWDDDQSWSKCWWKSRMGRGYIARLRSYIGAVRVLEQREAKVTGCNDCPVVNRDDWWGEPNGCNISDAHVSPKGPPPKSCPLRAGLVTIRLVTK